MVGQCHPTPSLVSRRLENLDNLSAYATGRLREGDGEVSLCDKHDNLVTSICD